MHESFRFVSDVQGRPEGVVKVKLDYNVMPHTQKMIFISGPNLRVRITFQQMWAVDSSFCCWQLISILECLVTGLLRAAAHQQRQDKHQDMRQKTQSCFIRDSDSSPHTEVARVCVLSHLL
jgi:hypothetical protein